MLFKGGCNVRHQLEGLPGAASQGSKGEGGTGGYQLKGANHPGRGSVPEDKERGKVMTLEERCEMMEKEIHAMRNNSRSRRRRTRCLIVAGAILITGALALGDVLGRSAQGAGKEEIRTQCFVLVDEKGQDRATFSILDGWPKLSMYDANGKERIFLGLWGGPSSKGNSRFSMYDDQGNVPFL